jgi:hypothetical protein
MLRSFDFFLYLGFVVLDYIDVLLLLLSLFDCVNDLDAADFLYFGLSLSFKELSFEVFFFQLVDRALAPLALL